MLTNVHPPVARLRTPIIKRYVDIPSCSTDIPLRDERFFLSMGGHERTVPVNDLPVYKKEIGAWHLLICIES